MLRRISAYIALISLVLVSLGPTSVKVASAATQTAAPRTHKKRAPEFEAVPNSTATVRALIQTKGGPTIAQDDAIRGAGGTKRASYGALNTIVADVPLNMIGSLAEREDVEYVSPDRPVKAQANLTNDTTGATEVQAGLQGMPGFTGRGVTIAVLDSGISANHPDFMEKNGSRVIAAADFTGSARTGDADGHGTGVASVAAGNGAASTGYGANYAGVAPAANLVDVRVLDENGAGRTSNVLAAINWVIENSARLKIRVINMSLGSPVRESFHLDPVCKAVEQANRAGLVVVASAGNQGRTEEIVGYNVDGSPVYQLAYGGINNPANSPYVITVGATDSQGTARRSDDTVAAFSSKGPTRFDHQAKPDLVAPGRKIVAAMSQEPNPTTPTEFPARIVQPVSPDATHNAYFNYSGTSFAAPVVSGTVALMLEANPSLTPLLVKSVLVRTAQRLPHASSGTKAETLFSQGAGLVNVVGAVEFARAIVPNADHLKAGDKIFKPNVTLSSLGQSVAIGGENVELSS
ncbi:MAG TPA: S8 family peptidase, partial [Pyrinomonadaceae bacterium]|nr:S8 family peptidase [Pyrinomonadaceae bacterium]